MREIKFRAIDELGNMVYGIPQTSTTLHLTLDCMAQYFTEQRLYGRQNVRIKPETLGQYTGRKDKNGVEIYEGDILKTYPIISSEGIGDDSFNVEVKWSGSCFIGNGILGALQAEISEVIGNIHQNPELLKKEAEK